MGSMRALQIALLVALVAALAACGGSKNGGGAGLSATSGGLVADVSKPQIVEGPEKITASAQIKVGGVAGKHLTLEWGLVDALQGNESQSEIVVRRYVTTRKVVTHEESVSIPTSKAFKPYLIHFVIYAPDGSYLDSVDTKEFGKGT